MSGIVGLVHGSGGFVDRLQLQQMTEALAYRGPDGITTWVQGCVGLGYAQLQTTPEANLEQQPWTLGSGLSIVADARLDGRLDLIHQLGAAGVVADPTMPDVELILWAYQVWNTACVQHLIGDFAFALWDSRCQRLFCARDQLGVKPFYYARVGRLLLLSNTLAVLQQHPAISREWNAQVIGDFLILGFNADVSATFYAEIQRLPPAHTLTWQVGETDTQPEIRRYWELPTDRQIRYSRPQDYVDHFQALLQVAVADRLRTDRVGLFMSGGLDSTAIAATVQQLANQGTPVTAQAYTTVYDRLMPDREREYAGLVAETLQLPIHYLVADDYPLFAVRESHRYRSEPMLDPLAAILTDQLSAMSTQARVALTGNGGDPVLLPSNSYFFELLQQQRWGEIGAALWHYWQWHRRLPPLGIRTWLRHRGRSQPIPWTVPVWLKPEFLAQLNWPERMARLDSVPEQVANGRAEAYQTILDPCWPNFFETCDPGWTGIPLEIRHPFFDLRLIQYLLAIPALPWFVQKHLLRVAMLGKLPQATRSRPKTPLPESPAKLRLKDYDLQWQDYIKPLLMLDNYIDLSLLPSPAEFAAGSSSADLHLLCLVQWLQQVQLTDSNQENPYALQ